MDQTICYLSIMNSTNNSMPGGIRTPSTPTRPTTSLGGSPHFSGLAGGPLKHKVRRLVVDVDIPANINCSPPPRRKRHRSKCVDILHLDEPEPNYGKRCKVGAHSVGAVGVCETTAIACTDVTSWCTGPDILGAMFNTFHTDPDGFVWNGAEHCFQASSRVQLAESVDRAMQFTNQMMNVSVEAPPHRRVEYTRIVWRQAQLQGTADLSSLRSSGAVTDAINPRELNQKVGSLLPWVRHLVESLAFIANDARGIYNNAALYMKGLTLVLTHGRMRLSNIPLPQPDLHLAPVTFLQIENIQQYVHQYQVIRNACEAGDFVFVEGYGWTRDDVVNTCYLALGGAPFAVVDEDHAIPTQSLRWPRIPILVLVTGALPLVPQQAPFNEESFMVFLRNTAVSRSEEADMAQGWYDASFLQGSEWIQDMPLQWPGGAAPQVPPVHGPDDAPPHFHLNDNADGDEGHIQYDLPPLHQPDPQARAEDVLNREMAAYQAAFGVWADQQRRQYERLVAQRQQQAAGGRGAAAAQAPPPPPDVSREAYIRAGHPEPVLRPPPVGSVRAARLHPLPLPAQPQGARPRPAPPARAAAWRAAEYAEWLRQNSRYRLVTPFWECNLRLEYARPMDTNFALRLGGYVSKHLCTQNVFPIKTCPILTTANRVPTFVRIAHWFGALLFTATTTIAWSYSFTGHTLQAISNYANPNRYFQFLIYSSGLIRRTTSGNFDGHPLLIALIGQWIKLNTNMIISPWLFGMRSWACSDVVAPQPADRWLAAAYPTHTPRRGTLLAMIRWMRQIPREWGLTGTGVTVDFRHEFLVWDGPAAIRGWYPENAEPRYTEQPKSEAPYLAIEYGPLAFNVMAQFIPQPNPLPVFNQRSMLVQRQLPNLTIMAPAPYPGGRGAPIFIQLLRCIEPCTLLNYDWQQNMELIPWVPQDYFDNGAMGWLADKTGPAHGVGITYGSTVAAPQLAPIGEALPGMLGALALARRGVAAAPEPDQARARQQEAQLGLNQPRLDGAIDPPAPQVLPNVVAPAGVVQPPAPPNDGAGN